MRNMYIICFGIIFVLRSTFANADLSFSAYSFSELFTKAECVVMGEVMDIKPEPSVYHMLVTVKETLMGSNRSSIVIDSPLYHGAFIEDQAYLERGTRYIMFLTFEGGTWSVVNGSAGVFHGEYITDIRQVTNAFSTNNVLFTKEHMPAQKKLFTSLTTKGSRRRLLEGMKGLFDESDEQFLKSLLESGEPYLQQYSAIQAGRAQVSGLSRIIASVCKQSPDVKVRSRCLMGLGFLKKPENTELIIQFFESLNTVEKENAIFAAGLIGDSSTIEPLMKSYFHETDNRIKCNIVNALCRMNNKEDSRLALETIVENEPDHGMKAFVNNKIMEL